MEHLRESALAPLWDAPYFILNLVVSLALNHRLMA
jgi:hypothetical protein